MSLEIADIETQWSDSVATIDVTIEGQSEEEFEWFSFWVIDSQTKNKIFCITDTASELWQYKRTHRIHDIQEGTYIFLISPLPNVLEPDENIGCNDPPSSVLNYGRFYDYKVIEITRNGDGIRPPTDSSTPYLLLGAAIVALILAGRK